MYCFLFKIQLSFVEEELAGPEVEAFKQTIVEKDSEIAELSKELETLQMRLHRVTGSQAHKPRDVRRCALRGR